MFLIIENAFIENLLLLFFFFREYIKKCQDKCVNKIDRDRMDIILKGKLTNANHDGSLWIKDWSKEPMPMYVLFSMDI